MVGLKYRHLFRLEGLYTYIQECAGHPVDIVPIIHEYIATRADETIRYNQLPICVECLKAVKKRKLKELIK